VGEVSGHIVDIILSIMVKLHVNMLAWLQKNWNVH